jgi:ADP-heptose:LPS heptosyltransferase
MKSLVISCRGLGDGLVSAVLSYNLYLNGYDVITLHDGNFHQLEKWFPCLSFKKFPKESLNIFNEFDKIFVSYDSVDPFIQSIIKEGKKHFPEKIKVLNPSISRKIGSQPFYEDAYFTRDISIVENIYNFCENILKLKKLSKKNGIRCPYDLDFRKNKKTVVIHPTSAKRGRSWPKENFLKLALRLKKGGFSPVFIMSEQEKKGWVSEGIDVRGFSSFDDLAKVIFESGFFIGNDSGIGHLASSLGICTLSISRSKRTTTLWRPGFSKGRVVCPSNLIPNISGFRLRDKKWKSFISVNNVFKNFLKIVSSDLI